MQEPDPMAVFERMYLAAADGRDALPWDRGAPHPLLAEWARDAAGAGGAGIANARNDPPAATQAVHAHGPARI